MCSHVAGDVADGDFLSFGDVAGHVAGDIARRANEAAPCRAIVLNIAARHRRPMVSHRQHRQLVPTVVFFRKSNTKESLWRVALVEFAS